MRTSALINRPSMLIHLRHNPHLAAPRFIQCPIAVFSRNFDFANSRRHLRHVWISALPRERHSSKLGLARRLAPWRGEAFSRWFADALSENLPQRASTRNSPTDHLFGARPDPAAWIALVTLVAMEIVLGVDILVRR